MKPTSGTLKQIPCFTQGKGPLCCGNATGGKRCMPLAAPSNPWCRQVNLHKTLINQLVNYYHNEFSENCRAWPLAEVE